MSLKEADFYSRTSGGSCACRLCPHHCVIEDGAAGFCRVRINRGGSLFSLSYGRIAAANIDPIEKKPLIGFMPGTSTFSIGTLGCNLDCDWCQNDSLSRGAYASEDQFRPRTPDEVVDAALAGGCPSISYTYNEPTVFAEFAIETAELAHRRGLKNVLVSNGFISPEAAEKLYRHIDAANFDVKGFTDEFYHRNIRGHLDCVLESVKYFYSLGKHLELTMLIIPTLNDDFELVERFLKWARTELSPEIIIHFSAFHPAHRCRKLPRTSAQTLFDLKALAEASGMKQIKLGNI